MNEVYIRQLDLQLCNGCRYRQLCFLHRVPLQFYHPIIQNFTINLIGKGFYLQDYDQRWHANYIDIQNQIIEYYNSHNCRLLENKIYALANEELQKRDEQRIKEEFKWLLDVAAKSTRKKAPQLSIIFDGIGLILAADYFEAINKVFAMFDILQESQTSLHKEPPCGYQTPMN